jgi:hypothetical protein
MELTDSSERLFSREDIGTAKSFLAISGKYQKSGCKKQALQPHKNWCF